MEGGQSLGSIVEEGQTGRRRVTDGPLKQGGYPLVYVLFAVDFEKWREGNCEVIFFQILCTWKGQLFY